jgi:hypothetical protein
MSLNSLKGITLLVTFLTLLSLAKGLNWEASGNITSDHTTFFWNYINGNYESIVADYDQATFCMKFSQALNGKWDEAWNVIVVMSMKANDAVVYGYSYKDHWYWFNGYRFGPWYISFVIWKDYNCHGWQKIGDSDLSDGFSTNQKKSDCYCRLWTSWKNK